MFRDPPPSDRERSRAIGLDRGDRSASLAIRSAAANRAALVLSLDFARDDREGRGGVAWGAASVRLRVALHRL